MSRVPAPSPALDEAEANDTTGICGDGSLMLNWLKLSLGGSVPPPRPLDVTVPTPMFTVSPLASVVLSVVADRVMVTEFALCPPLGPVKVTVGVPLLMLAQLTPVGSVPGQASV